MDVALLQAREGRAQVTETKIRAQVNEWAKDNGACSVDEIVAFTQWRDKLERKRLHKALEDKKYWCTYRSQAEGVEKEMYG
jgi:hypothetical protein